MLRTDLNASSQKGYQGVREAIENNNSWQGNEATSFEEKRKRCDFCVQKNLMGATSEHFTILPRV